MPLFLGVVFAIFGYLLLHIQEAGMLVKGLMFCTITNTLIIIIITRYWKISIHTMGSLHSKEYLFIMFVILFFVAYSRVILKAHNIPQVTTGSLLGLILTLIQIHFLFVQI